MNQFEIGLLDAIAKTRTAFGDRFFSLVTHLGDAGIFWILLAVALCGVKKTRRAGAAMAASLVCMLLLCNICLKPLVHRVRPYDVNTAVVLLIGKPRDFSFPSGHTAASFAGATSLLFGGRRRLGWFMLALACVIAFSRLYLYVHYPTDVLGGVCVGTLCGWLGNALIGCAEKKAGKKKNA